MRLYFSPCVGNKGPKCLTVRLLIMATLRMLLSPPSWGGNGRVVTVHRASLQCIYAFYTPNRALMVNVSDDATNKTKEKNTNRKKIRKLYRKCMRGVERESCAHARRDDDDTHRLCNNNNNNIVTFACYAHIEFSKISWVMRITYRQRYDEYSVRAVMVCVV